MTQYYFSPNGTTKLCVECISRAMGETKAVRDLLLKPIAAEETVPAEEPVVVGVPVYAGRIPALCAEQLGKLKGNGGSAVAVAVYGNRDYDDALLELTDLLEGNGFRVAGAGAFVAQHSIFPKVGAGRPDRADKAAMEAFGEACAKRLSGGGKISVKGNRPYKDPGAVPLKPSGDGKCTGCGACAKICPTSSIDPADPKKTKTDTCISCGGCIRVCPAASRRFRGPAYKVASLAFEKKCAGRREPEVFYGDAHGA